MQILYNHIAKALIKPDITDFILVWLLMSVFLIIRYFILAGIFQLISNQSKKEKLGTKPLFKGQILFEIIHSIQSSVVFAFFGALGVIFWSFGWTQIYITPNPSLFGYLYLPISFFLSMFVHETYYYFLHRWMHQPKVYRKVHKVHHDSLTTTPWTGFSFHWVEAALQAPGLILIICLLPLNLFVLVAHLLTMSILGISDHLDVELYPKWFLRSKVGQYIIGASHHSQHHKLFRFNYGLYFTFWDKWLKTEKEIKF